MPSPAGGNIRPISSTFYARVNCHARSCYRLHRPTPIGRAYRGAINNIKSPTMMAQAIRHAVERAGIEGGEIEDVVIGTVPGAGTAGTNIARNAMLRPACRKASAPRPSTGNAPRA
jgi:hypothetical protein